MNAVPEISPATIPGMLRTNGAEVPDRLAILAPGREPLVHADLWHQVERSGSCMRAAGISRQDRVAVILPNGPEMATAFLAIGSAAVCAPLNPAYTDSEFEFYLSDLAASAVLLGAGTDSPARAVAKRLGVRIIELESGGPAGAFDLRGLSPADGSREDAPRGPDPDPDDVALILHTSGTTARPKMVPLTHRNLRASARNVRNSLSLGGSDRCLNIMPLFHIHGLIAGLLASLEAGGSVICTPGFGHDFLKWADELAPTWYTAVPTMHREILAAIRDRGEAAPPFRFARSSSASLPPSLMLELEEALGAPVIEAYGMTEAAHQMASALPPALRKPGTVGVAAGPDLEIIGEDGIFVPTGTSGEIVVRGENVMGGYLATDPAVNEAAFVDGWFRTGDLGVMDENGFLTIVGRVKEQINRGGEKVSPREIDDVLMEHPEVVQAVAFAVPHSSLGEEVAAAVVLREGAGVGADELRAVAAQRLAPYKVPKVIVIVEQIPTGPTGKFQRIGLADALGVGSPPVSAADAEATASALESEVTEIWAEILGLDSVGPTDNFFLTGGDSLSATRLAARIRDRFGVQVELWNFWYSAATVSGLSDLIEDLRAAPVSDASLVSGPSPLDRSMARASFGQEGMWLLHESDPASPALNIALTMRMRGALDVDALRATIGYLALRHASLRTSFKVIDGEVHQIIEEHPRLELEIEELEPGGDLFRSAIDESNRPFDLSEPPVRARLIRADEDQLLLLTTHHIVSDGWSRDVLAREIPPVYAAFSAGGRPHLEDLPYGFADFAEWERQRLGDVSHLGELERYWTRTMEGAPPTLDLFGEGPRGTGRGSRSLVEIPADVTQALSRVARERGVTLFMALCAGFASLLRRYTGVEDIVIGTNIAARERSEMEGMVGLFMNSVPLRLDVSGDPTFEELLDRAREVCSGAYAHGAYPMDMLVRALAPARIPGRTAVIQVSLDLRPSPPPLPDGGAIAFSLEDVDTGIATLDLAVNVFEGADGLRCAFVHGDAFDAASIERMGAHFAELLRNVSGFPDRRLSQVPMLGEDERRRILEGCFGPAVQSPFQPVDALFRAAAEAMPGAVAVVDADESVTYAELGSRADALGRRLVNAGVEAGSFVALNLESSVDLVASMLAVVKVGAAYVPLNPLDPMERRSFILEDSKASVVVSRSELPGPPTVLIGGRSDRPADSVTPVFWSDASQEDAMYVAYTSGSTGRPKGVVTSHGGFANLLVGENGVELGPKEVLAQSTEPSFDVASFEIWGALAAGARIVAVPRQLLLDPAELEVLLDAQGVTTASLSTALLHEIAAVRPAMFASRQLIFGGETVNPAAVRSIIEAGAPRRLVHWYGPTEASVFATTHVFTSVADDARTISIGRPIGGVRVYVLGPDGDVAPTGVPGELRIGGAGVGLGYLGLADQTAAAFVPDPFHAEGMTYRTGDLARFTSSGDLEFLGRADDQIKIRGYRIEPAEIDAVLARHPAIAESLTIGRKGAGAELTLATYFVAAETADAEDLRRHLKVSLPEYMIPRDFVRLERFPLNSNGKIDRSALPSPRRSSDSRSTEPSGDIVSNRLAQVWRGLLDLDIDCPIGLDESFFDLGGDSLQVVRMLALLDAVGQKVPVSVFLADPTLGGLADAMRSRVRDDSSPLLWVLRADGEKVPLFAVAGGGPGEGLAFRHFLVPLEGRPVYVLGGVLPPGNVPRWMSVEETASAMIAEMKRVRPEGPYLVCGWCNGGIIAHEIGRQLGEQASLVILLDTAWPKGLKGMRERGRVVKNRLYLLRRKLLGAPGREPVVHQREDEEWIVRDLYGNYRPRSFHRRLVLMSTDEYVARAGGDRTLGWRRAAGFEPDVLRMPGTHYGAMRLPDVTVVADEVARLLDRSGGAVS